MDVSIIIVNYKTRGLVKQALKSIRREAPKLRYEVLVTDNASGDGSAEMMREQFPEVKLFALDENVGFARGNNIAMKEAKGKYVFIMNPDAMLTEGALEGMFQYMETHTEIGLLGPKLMHPDKSMQESVHRFPTPWTPLYRRTPLGKLPHARREMHRYFMRGELDSDKSKDVDWMEGAALFARRNAIREVGMFDERYFAYMEDADWARRFWNRGWRVVWYPKAVILHYHRRQSADAPWFMGLTNRVTRIHIASAIKYFAKWKGEPHPEHQ